MSEGTKIGIETARNCLNFKLRRAARPLARYYDEALRPAGLRVTQFNILVAVALSGEPTVLQLADIMAMERSALARNLKPLERDGLLKTAPGRDRRTRIARITPSGRKKLAAAMPLWEKAQNALIERLSDKALADFDAALAVLSAALPKGGTDENSET